MMSLPISLTLVRLVASPLFLGLYLYAEPLGLSLKALAYLLLLLTILSELSDFFDGFLARKYNEVTDLGKILDPMADSIFRQTAFFAFTQGVVALPLSIVFLIFFREALVSCVRTLCALNGFALAARTSGKIKAILQGTTIFLILILMALFASDIITLARLQQISLIGALFTALYTVFSGIEYISSNWSYITRTFKKI